MSEIQQPLTKEQVAEYVAIMSARQEYLRKERADSGADAGQLFVTDMRYREVSDIANALRELLDLRAEVERLRQENLSMKIALRAYEYEFSWDGERHWAGPEEGPAIARRALRAINDELVSDA